LSNVARLGRLAAQNPKTLEAKKKRIKETIAILEKMRDTNDFSYLLAYEAFDLRLELLKIKLAALETKK
jgi:hypothetical protein